VSVGLGVWRDVREVQEFYSLISGTRAVLENRCVDLTSPAVLARTIGKRSRCLTRRSLLFLLWLLLVLEPLSSTSSVVSREHERSRRRTA